MSQSNGPLAVAGRRGGAFEEAFHRLASDLLSLEINTIIKSNIMGTVMPRMGHALIGILKDYTDQLAQIESRLGIVSKSKQPDREKADRDAFDKLREWASELYGSQGWEQLGEEQSANKLMLCRIRDNSDEIKDILENVEKRGNPPPSFERTNVAPISLLPEQVLRIRKIWEIGVETIEMQTVIQLDGDVVTRIRPQRARIANDPLFAIHNSAVSTSIGTWTRLVDTVGAFAKTLVSAFFPGRPKLTE